MIIKARAGKGGQALARYLEGGKNDQAEVLEYRNMDAASLKQAIFRMDTIAERSHCEKHALHVQMRAAHGEHLSAEHWKEAADRYAEAFGMEDHQAAVVLHHQPDGCTHCHLVINRVHPETLKAADIWQNYKTHKDLARELEKDFGLQIVTNEKSKPRDYSNAGRPETEQARRTGENVHDIRDRIKSAWEQSDNGQSFSAALEADGFTLATGDRRDFVAVDENGHPYSIGKRTTGASAAEVRAKLADLEPETIPSVLAVKLSIDLAAEEEAKLEKERKGKGEASAALAMKEAQGKREYLKPSDIRERGRERIEEAAHQARAQEGEPQQPAPAKKTMSQEEADKRQNEDLERRQRQQLEEMLKAWRAGNTQGGGRKYEP